STCRGLFAEACRQRAARSCIAAGQGANIGKETSAHGIGNGGSAARAICGAACGERRNTGDLDSRGEARLCGSTRRLRCPGERRKKTLETADDCQPRSGPRSKTVCADSPVVRGEPGTSDAD